MPSPSQFVLYGHMLSQPTRAILWFCHLNSIPIQFRLVRLNRLEHKKPQFLQWNPNGKIPVLVHEQFILFESQAIVHYLRRWKQQQQQQQQSSNVTTTTVVDQWYPELDVRSSSSSSSSSCTTDQIIHRQQQQLARIDSYLSWHQNHFRPGVATYGFRKYVGPQIFGVQFSEKDVEEARKPCVQVLAQLNDYWLSPSTPSTTSTLFIGQVAQPSMADLFCYSELAQLMMIDEWDVDRASSQGSFSFSSAPIVAQYGNVVQWMRRVEQLDGYLTVHAELIKVARERFGQRSKL